MKREYEIIKWKGIKDNGTKKVAYGYLFVKFISTTRIINVNPNVIGAKIETYDVGRTIGFNIKADNRKEAVKTFQLNYQIIH